MVLYQEDVNPSEKEWDAYLATLEPTLGEPELLRSLVITGGAFPSRRQQARLVSVVDGRTPRVAVVSPAPILRFVVSMLALLNRNIRCFTPTQQQAAFAHLGLRPADHAIAQAAIERLRRRLRPADTSAA
jgi:hypothetical protein